MLTSAWYACFMKHHLELSARWLHTAEEAYIVNTRNNASGTSGESDKYNSSIQLEFTYKAIRSDVEDLPLPHTCTYTHAHTQAPMLMTFVFLRSNDTQNCSLVARPLFSFPSLSEHTARNKMQSESRAAPILHEIKGSIIKRLFWCLLLVWFPDPSCMGGAREGREGSGE